MIETDLTRVGYWELERQSAAMFDRWELVMDMQCVYLCAPNDRSGNPRRAWVFTGDDREAFFEGHEGLAGVSQFWTDRERALAGSAMRVNVTFKEWKRLTGARW